MPREERLIDAYHLDDKLRENDWTSNYPPLDEISEIIDLEPTVEAVPLSFILRFVKEHDADECSAVTMRMLSDWYREQVKEGEQ